jgi:hypothetical protein
MPMCLKSLKPIKQEDIVSEPIQNFMQASEPLHTGSKRAAQPSHVPIATLGWSLSLFFSLSFVLCVLFDLWFPAYAMNTAWAALLPGFTWISWTSVLIGLAETFAYGWYIALFFGGLYNLLQRRTSTSNQV